VAGASVGAGVCGDLVGELVGYSNKEQDDVKILKTAT
jgi:hypothetical protein